jgi:hypothetical protein
MGDPRVQGRVGDGLQLLLLLRDRYENRAGIETGVEQVHRTSFVSQMRIDGRIIG